MSNEYETCEGCVNMGNSTLPPGRCSECERCDSDKDIDMFTPSLQCRQVQALERIAGRLTVLVGLRKLDHGMDPSED